MMNRIPPLPVVSLLGTVALSVQLHAADLVVEENAISPNFSTIQAAVTAASPNDRIFIKDKSGNIPYQENVTIDKAVELLPHTANGQFLVFGNFTISPNAIGFPANNNGVRIVGMLNQSGSINASANNGTGSSIDVQVLGCQLNSGSLNISGTNFRSAVAGNWLLSGSITTREATISGNLVNGNIIINDAAGFVTGGDTLYIVGNRITTNTGAITNGRISWSNNDHYFHIANNWVRSNQSNAIHITQIRTGTENNDIVNNSTECNSTGANRGVYCSATLTSGTRLRIENNAFHDEVDSVASGEYAVTFTNVQAGSIASVNYNVLDGFISLMAANPNVSVTGNTTASTTFNPNDTTGECTDTTCINAGHPGTDYTDHDLSRNDRGVAGGSYNYNNFWPILTGGARVFLVKTPRSVLQGSTIDAEGDAHDR